VRQRESMAVLRVHADVLVMTTMLWPDEVREPDFPFLRDDPPQIRPQELSMAGSLIDSLAEPVFEPEKYRDHYREALEQMIEAKVAGEETTKPAAVTAKADVVDLMAALQASVDAAKKSRQSSSEESDEDAKPAAAKKKPAARKRAPKSA